MKKIEIEKRNKDIAVLLGKTLISAEDFNKLGENSYTGENKNVKWGIIEYLKYNLDWNHLMDAVEFIETLNNISIYNRTIYNNVKFHRHNVLIYYHNYNKYVLHYELTNHPVTDSTFKHPMYKKQIVKQYDFDKNTKINALFYAISDFANLYNNKLL
jgi:hypothetical protein